MVEDGKPQEQTPPKETKKSVLEETREAIEQLKKEKEEVSKIRDQLEQLKSDQLLSGTAGIRSEPKPPQEESDKDYANKLISKPYGDQKFESTGF